MESRKIVAYIRYSSDKQKETSLEEQKLAISRFANSRGEVIDKYYSDSAKSGTNTNRKDYQDLLSDIGADSIKSIYCYSLDRLHREGNDAEVFRQLCNSHDVLIVEASSQRIYDDSIDAKYAYRDKANSSERYSEELAKRVRLSKEASAARHEETGGVPPYGYSIENKKLIVNADEAPAVKLIFERYLDGFSYPQIISELKEKGYKPRTGKEFCKSTIHDILKQKKYCGYYQFRMKPQKKHGKFSNSSKILPGEEAANNHEAIISEETFSLAQEKLLMRSEGRATALNKGNYILNGLVYCSNCGSQMNGTVKPGGMKKQKYRYYQCKNHITHECSCKDVSADALENITLHVLFDNIMQNPTELAEILTSQLRATNNKAKIDDLQKRKAGLKKKVENGSEAILKSGNIPPIIEALNKTYEELGKVEKQLEELKTVTTRQIEGHEIKALSTNFYTEVKKYYPELVKAVNASVDRIDVGDDKIIINYKII